MNRRHARIVVALTAGTMVACQDSPPVPTAVQRIGSLQSAAAPDSTAISPQGPYTAIDLGTFGGTNGEALSLNKFDAVVGFANDSMGSPRAFLWQKGVMQKLSDLGGSSSLAFAINDKGDIAGVSQVPGGGLHVVLWTNGTIQDLGAEAGGIPHFNAVGDVAFDGPVPGGIHAFRWHAGVLQDLGTLGGPISRATGINDRGDVTGSSSDNSVVTDADAFIWSNGQMQDIPSPIAGASMHPVGINDRGSIAGTLLLGGATVQERAWIWDGTSMTTIPLLPGNQSSYSVAVTIDAHGNVYGDNLNLAFDNPVVFAWTHDSTTPLNPSLTIGQQVTDVNDRGMATGSEPFNPHSNHAFVLDNGTDYSLGVLSAGTSGGGSTGLQINSGGDVVGYSTTLNGGVNHPVLWRRTH